MIRALIFDFNGVLADDDPVHMRALRQVAEEEGLTFSDEEYLDKYLPLNDWDCFKTLYAKHSAPLPDAKLGDLIRRKSVYYFQAIAKKSVMFEKAVEAVRAGFRIALSRARIPGAPPIERAGAPRTAASGRTILAAFIETPKKSMSTPTPSARRRGPVASPPASEPIETRRIAVTRIAPAVTGPYLANLEGGRTEPSRTAEIGATSPDLLVIGAPVVERREKMHVGPVSGGLIEDGAERPLLIVRSGQAALSK